jgi:hypothetical protein
MWGVNSQRLGPPFAEMPAGRALVAMSRPVIVSIRDCRTGNQIYDRCKIKKLWGADMAVAGGGTLSMSPRTFRFINEQELEIRNDSRRLKVLNVSKKQSNGDATPIFSQWH